MLAQAQQRLRRHDNQHEERSPVGPKPRQPQSTLQAKVTQNSQSHTMVHDYIPKEHSRASQASPIKRQASPVKSSKRPYSAYKSPQKRQPVSSSGGGGYAHQHHQQHSSAAMGNSNKHIPSYMQMTASYCASRTAATKGSAQQSSSFYDQSRMSPQRPAASRYMDHQSGPSGAHVASASRHQ